MWNKLSYSLKWVFVCLYFTIYYCTHLYREHLAVWTTDHDKFFNNHFLLCRSSHSHCRSSFRQTYAHVTLVLSSNAYRLACPQHQRQNRRSVWFTLLKKIHCSAKAFRNDLCIFNESTSNVQCIFYYPLIGPFPRTFLNDNTSDRPCQTRRQLFSSVLIVIVLTALLILIFWKNYDRQNHCIKDESSEYA